MPTPVSFYCQTHDLEAADHDTIRQNSTVSEETLENGLSHLQISVLAALTNGASISEATRRAGVHRATIHNWLDKDAAFVTSLNCLNSPWCAPG